MPRPQKHRRVCTHPRCSSFRPQAGEGQAVTMTLDEYEVIRLIDLEGRNQEQCARQMEVARTTVQAIYAVARKKLALCIVKGHPLVIEGGNVRLCEHRGPSCEGGCCRWAGNQTERNETGNE